MAHPCPNNTHCLVIRHSVLDLIQYFIAYNLGIAMTTF